MQIHELKIVEPYYSAVKSGVKTFEIRKNDRNFQVGDTVILRPWNSEQGYHGESLRRKIEYITSFEQKKGYVVFSIKE